jgi:uncharacterized protein YfaS (alpha-2-macroglobulin family)
LNLVALILSVISFLPIPGSSLAGVVAQIAAAGTGYESLRAAAEKAFAEGSFTQAHELYAKVDPASLPPAETKWVRFRLADTQWRSLDDETGDTTLRDAAHAELQALVREAGADHDRLWAEVQESLGDFARVYGGDVSGSTNALDWWAGSGEVETARERYLAIVRKMGSAVRARNNYYQPSAIPREVLENALSLAKTPSDRALFAFQLAQQLQTQADPASAERAADLYEQVLAAGKSNEWYDDALIAYAAWLEWYGRVVVAEDGTNARRVDYVKAAALYSRLLAEFAPGQSQYVEQAKSSLRQLTNPSLNVSVSNVFLPGSEVQAGLTWRNVKTIELSLIPVDLTRDVAWKNISEWSKAIDVAGRAPLRSWTRQTNDDGTHKPGNEQLRIEPKLPAGAYLLVARTGGITERALILVTDASVVTRVSPTKLLVFACNAITGAPLPNARVSAVAINQGKPRTYAATTGSNGLAEVALEKHDWAQLFVAIAQDSAHQAIAQTYVNSSGAADRGSWRIYAYTDRPAYRPHETVRFKFTGRLLNGEVYRNPAGASLHWEITDPRGAKVSEGTSKLNLFGSAWGSLELTETMPLGAYTIQFRDGTNDVGGAQLFRLEEYKLPEFKVDVRTPERDGVRKVYRLGDVVEASVEVAYYFGGPVANAKVEAVVHQQPYHRWWWEDSPYAWYYRGEQPYGGGDTIVKREELTTDASGHAVIRFPTPANGSDMEYRIEARVVDASRREVVGSGNLRVMSQRYSVTATPRHWLSRPNEKIRIDFKAVDANDNPVRTTGTVKVTRDWWNEIWLDPQGREVRGRELEKARAGMAIFPPRPIDPCGWRLKSRGYEHEEVATTTLSTDEQGEATFTFTPPRDGYYRVSWSSPDREEGTKGSLRVRDFVKAETTLWVATEASVDIGYRNDGIEVIVDRAAYRRGQKAPVMIVTPASGRWVLFSVAGNDMIDTQVVHLDGTARFMEIALDERHVPNVFITATTVAGGQISTDTKELVVPPVENFIDVDVTADRAEYDAQQPGTFTVTTKDVDGKPIAAEVALGVADESVYAIQSELAGDPRQFFYGSKRSQSITQTSSFDQGRYLRLLETDRGLVSEPFLFDSVQEVGGVVGGVLGGVAQEAAARYSAHDAMTVNAPPPPPAPVMAPAEALRVSPAAVGMLQMKAARNESAQSAPAEAAVQVRTDFRSTLFWQPDIITGADGKATVKVTYPDALTTWRATARAVSQSNQFGMSTASTRTRKLLIVRLEGPRFFVVGDKVVISAVVNNNTDAVMHVRPSLDVEGLTPESGGETKALDVPPNGEARADWIVTARKSGEAKLRVTARGPELADAMERTFTVYEHGVDKLLAHSGKLRTDEALVKIDLPARRPGSTVMIVQVAPSLAVTMLDALPYLIDYPYGCTEQTMSRFLPAAIVARTLTKLGLDPGDIAGHLFGGIEPAGAAATHPKGKHDLKELDKITAASMSRLYDFQHDDGGWGWWKGGESDPWMTAYVIWGFSVARDGGLDVRSAALENASFYLSRQLVKAEFDVDTQAWMLHALSAWQPAKSDPLQAKALENVWKNHQKLSAYSRALLAVVLEQRGQHDRALLMIRNLENGVKRDAAPDNSVLIRGAGGRTATSAETMSTAHWGEDGGWWRWNQGPVETTSFALRALMRVDPKNALVEPVMNWLVKNRRGAQWNNTRDTAIAVLALHDYLTASGELASATSYEIAVNGSTITTQNVTPAEVLRAPSRFTVDPALVRDGVNEVRIRRTSGSGPLYFAAEARFFSLEEPVKAAGSELFVRRDYFRLAPHPTLLKGTMYDREPIRDGGWVKSGERVEVVVTVETKNDYEYLLFEDLKPAGLEAIELQSGTSLWATELKSGAVDRKFVQQSQPAARKVSAVQRPGNPDNTGRTRWVYQELRDRKVALFVDHLPQGVWEIHYTLRAEVPGTFHALPLLGQAMYVPEIRANSDEVRLEVRE